MVRTQHGAHGVGGFAVGVGGIVAALVHGVEDAAVNGFQAVADIGQCTGNDDRHGVIQKRGLDLLFHIAHDDLGAGTRRHNDIFFHLVLTFLGRIETKLRSCFTAPLPGKTTSYRGVLPFCRQKGSEKAPPFRCGGRRPGLRPRTPRCGHLTTAYSPAWGPVNKENDFIPFPDSSCLTERVLGCPARFLNPHLAQAPQGLSRPSRRGGRIRVQGFTPGRRPPHRNGGPFSLPFRARKGRTKQ